MVTVLLLSATFAVAAGIGYTASQPLLSDGSAFLSRGHTVAHVSGETGKSDAEIAMQLATGKEELQPVRLPDGRLAVVNKTTGTVSFFDTATLAPSSPPTNRPGSAGKIEPVATSADAYLVDRERQTVEKIGLPSEPAPAAVPIPGGITAAVPAGDSLWVISGQGEVTEVVAGKAVRTVRLGMTAAGMTVADHHSVVVAQDGTAYTLDSAQPRAIGNVGVSGTSLVLATWRGAGRYVVAVDRATGRVGVLDPRTGTQRTFTFKAPQRKPDFDAPVLLGERIYVPDRAGPSLWRIDLAKGTADDTPLDVPGQPGAFSLTVESGRVWANSQYDRRSLIIDGDGHHHYGDKGTGAELGDTEGQQGSGGASGGPAGPGGQPGGVPAGGPGGGEAPAVTLPTFPRGTPYREACKAITELKLVCRAVAVGDDSGLRTGDVVNTEPAGGQQVPAGSRVIVRYSGPLRTPAVLDVWHEDACRQIRAARLTCDAQVDPAPALAPERLGRVLTQTPAPQGSIAKGGRVTVTYPDSVALPSFADQASGAACDRLQTVYRMTCRAVEGNPPAAGTTPGQVYAQDPPAATVARMGATVTLTYYRGRSAVPQALGTNVSAACAAVQSAGFVCQPVQGRTAWGTGRPAAEVYDQAPPATTQAAVGTQVTLTYYSDQMELPNYGGLNIDTACNDLAARGFQCHREAHPHRSVNVVFGQNLPPGVYTLGTMVTVYYSPWAMVDLWVTQFGPSWQLATSGAWRIGLAYPPQAIPGGRTIYQYMCSLGGTRCRGYGTNVFYSAMPPGTPTIDPDFNSAVFATFMTCNGTPGQVRVWRTWNAGNPRRYGVVVSDGKPIAPPSGDAEELGCVWN